MLISVLRHPTSSDEKLEQIDVVDVKRIPCTEEYIKIDNKYYYVKNVIHLAGAQAFEIVAKVFVIGKGDYLSFTFDIK